MLRDDDLESVLLRRLSLERDQRARVTRGDHAGRDRRLDRGASGEETQRLRHRDTMLTKPLRDLLVRESELLAQASQAARLLDGIEVRALEVFDEAEDQLLVVARLAAYDRGHLAETRKPGARGRTQRGGQRRAAGPRAPGRDPQARCPRSEEHTSE